MASSAFQEGHLVCRRASLFTHKLWHKFPRVLSVVHVRHYGFFCLPWERGQRIFSSIDACLQVLSKTMDSATLSPEKIELSTVRKDEENDEVGYS